MTATTSRAAVSSLAETFAAQVGFLVQERFDLLSLPMPNPARHEAAKELGAALATLCDCCPDGPLPVLLDAITLMDAAYARAVGEGLPTDAIDAMDLSGVVMFLLLDRMQAVSRLH